ncbi:50S ribosomal protein L31 [Mycoplasmoides alvi]|uniref:50S ribosomal protein L31 n=1 Tax=Mycoplasmoides alvi TaxID=78580 RepID=UPI00051C54BB|nr:50S ribosomal protein L31 [Mycoplasmoides alvi]
MKKGIHLESTKTIFTCASCNSKFDITSTLSATEVTIDICSKCHPFYIGSTSQQTIKGRAEKLSSKFATGKQVISKPSSSKTIKEKTTLKSNSKKAKSLEDL